VFSGVGKTADDIAVALKAGVWRFNLESRDELDLLDHVAAEHAVQADASVRINPDVDARTHAKISTGRAGDKFGVPIEEARYWFRQRARWPHVRLDGLHMHIGSQILDLSPVREALARLSAFWRELVDMGHEIGCIDVGGGLGVRYREGEKAPDADAYVTLIREALDGFRGRIVLEPGRYLVAEAGVLLSRVVRAKAAGGRTFLVLDAGMNDLARPGLYGAWHDIARLGDATGRSTIAYDIVGPVCESSDVFAVSRALPRCDPGDLVAIGGTGAYGAAMASTYNSRPLAAEVMVDGARHAVVRRRQCLEELVAGEAETIEWRDG
jgi:diaminopimelate decarboxylase